MSGFRHPPGDHSERPPASAGSAAAQAPPGPAPGREPDLVLATRGSDLALAQARLVGAAVTAAHPGTGWRLLTITTRGDHSAGSGAGELAAQARTRPGVFTSEVAAAVARGAADAAVHSLKDLPLDDRAGLSLAAILPRAAVADVLVVAPGWIDAEAPLGLRRGATVGTSSPRRAALLRRFAPQARAVELRGNVPTRLRRCGEGAVAAVVLAHAGLQRLGASLAGLRRAPLPPEHWQPAPGQGALAVQASPGGAAAATLAALDHAPTRTAVELERGVLRALGGGCAAPCGAYARPAPCGGAWRVDYGFAGDDGRWRGYRLTDSAAGCRRALMAWAGGGPLPGSELAAEAAQVELEAVLFGTT